ncbi:hypothetical protein GJ496_011674 [Pomphorhynchus laevis]|nr:hypothetical protein GJ496_011674 [Pomphorhynchus laevis]
MDLYKDVSGKSVREILLDKHPDGAELCGDALLEQSIQNSLDFHPVISNTIDSSQIVSSAKRVKKRCRTLRFGCQVMEPHANRFWRLSLRNDGIDIRDATSSTDFEYSASLQICGPCLNGVGDIELIRTQEAICRQTRSERQKIEIN